MKHAIGLGLLIWAISTLLLSLIVYAIWSREVKWWQAILLISIFTVPLAVAVGMLN